MPAEHERWPPPWPHPRPGSSRPHRCRGEPRPGRGSRPPRRHGQVSACPRSQGRACLRRGGVLEADASPSPPAEAMRLPSGLHAAAKTRCPGARGRWPGRAWAEALEVGTIPQPRRSGRPDSHPVSHFADPAEAAGVQLPPGRPGTSARGSDPAGSTRPVPLPDVLQARLRCSESSADRPRGVCLEGQLPHRAVASWCCSCPSS